MQVCNLPQHSFFPEFLAGSLMAVQNKLSAFDSYHIYFTFAPVTALVNVISVLNTGSPFAKVQSIYPSTIS